MLSRLIALFFSVSLLPFFSTINPGPRQSGALIYFPPLSSLVLLDGFVVHPQQGNEAWSWNGREWRKTEAIGPDTKTLSSGDYDSDQKRLVMFGGIGSKGYESLHGDTWAFDGVHWKKINTNTIGTRDHHKMVYLTHESAFLLYGGQDSLRKFDSSTWILKNGQWQKMDLPGPGARFHFGMAYDKERKVVVLYGGYNRDGLQQDTWEFDGQHWKEIKITGPGPRGRFAMSYDSDRKMVIMFGGDVWKKKTADGEVWDVRGDLWGFDGKAWQKLSGEGPARMMASLGYDPKRKVVVVFGGGGEAEQTFADTWEFANNKWSRKDNDGAWKWDGKEYKKIE